VVKATFSDFNFSKDALLREENGRVYKAATEALRNLMPELDKNIKEISIVSNEFQQARFFEIL
jgi:hypothetical protein